MPILPLKFIFAILVLLLSACSYLPASASQTQEIRIADSKGDWGYPNPYLHYPRGPGYIRMSWVFDTLIWKDKDGYIPALARQWSYDPDKLCFTFKLHPKAKWHDGKSLTAEDVVFTLDYFQEHPYRWITVDRVDRAEAVGLHTVRIYLSKPYAPFLSDIGGTMPIIPEHIWKDVEHPQKYKQKEAFIGSGPYLFRDFNKAKGTYLYEAFSHYYQGRPAAERLIYVRTGKALVSLLTGQVDLANIQPEMAGQLRQKGMQVIQNERGWNKKLMINHHKFPFDQADFRRALAYAIDREEIIAKAHRGHATPASYGLLSIDHPMYNPDTPTYDHNPQKAQELIESLGYGKNKNGIYYRDGQPLHIELLTSNITVAGENVTDRDGEIIQKHLQEIGMQVKLTNMEQSTTDSRVRNWNFDLAVSGHGGIAGDPRILVEMISSRYGAGSVNSARYDADAQLNRLLEEQMREMNREKRKKIVFAIQEIYARLLPAISLYYPDSMAAYNPDKGIKWFYTQGGISKGIPIPQNKMSLIRAGN